MGARIAGCIVWFLSLVALGGCTFQIAGIDPFAAALSDGGAGDGEDGDGALQPSPDGAPQGAKVLFSLDARSSALFQNRAQPYLKDLPPATLAHYRFDQANDPIKDLVGANDLSPLPGGKHLRQVFTHLPPPGASAFIRSGIELRGPGLTAPGPAFLDVAGDDLSVEVWLKVPPGYAPVGGGCDPIFGKGKPTGRGYRACVGVGGQPRMVVSDGVATKTVAGDAALLADGAWHLCAFVFRPGAQNQSALYVDGRDLLPAPSDLSIAGGLGNTDLFTVGGAGGEFRGSLAELVLHKRVLSLAEHRANYLAFQPPFTAAVGATDFTYRHDGTLCPVISVDSGPGERVACYAGGGGQPAQFALAHLPGADPTMNPGRLGMLTGGDGANHAWSTEQLDRWKPGWLALAADAVVSPRGDLTAESIDLPANGYLYQATDLAGNLTVTFSTWLQGKKDGDRVYLTLSDSLDAEPGRCLITLSRRWQRWSCTQTYAKKPAAIQVQIDTLKYPKDAQALPRVQFDAWGAQVEIGSVPSVYVPNPSPLRSFVPQGAVSLVLANPGGRLLGGAVGRVALSFTGDPALVDGSYLLDAASPMISLDRRALRRGAGGSGEAVVLDSGGLGGTGSTVGSGPLAWDKTHLFDLVWSAAAPLTGNLHTVLHVDGNIFPGRPDAFLATPPPALHIGESASGTSRPSGALHFVTAWDRP
ncbi:MAG: LamG domain-containing protein [Myxococcales bacterium]|nr:LamG domain-containing protein [Myxococcales bacterium]